MAGIAGTAGPECTTLCIVGMAAVAVGGRVRRLGPAGTIVLGFGVAYLAEATIAGGIDPTGVAVGIGNGPGRGVDEVNAATDHGKVIGCTVRIMAFTARHVLWSIGIAARMGAHVAEAGIGDLTRVIMAIGTGNIGRTVAKAGKRTVRVSEHATDVPGIRIMAVRTGLARQADADLAMSPGGKGRFVRSRNTIYDRKCAGVAAFTGNPAVVPLNGRHLLVTVGRTGCKRRLDGLVYVGHPVFTSVGMALLAPRHRRGGKLRAVGCTEMFEVSIGTDQAAANRRGSGMAGTAGAGRCGVPLR